MIDSRLFVRINEMEGKWAPRPLPLENGFTTDKLYRVVGDFTHGNDGEHLLLLVNDLDQLWFISNRHVKYAAFDHDNSHMGVAYPNGTSAL